MTVADKLTRLRELVPPSRDAEAATLLAELEQELTGEHVLMVIERGSSADLDHGLRQHVDWGLQHPLACRPNLTSCPVHVAASTQMSRDPLVPGTYEVGVDAGGKLTIAEEAV